MSKSNRVFIFSILALGLIATAVGIGRQAWAADLAALRTQPAAQPANLDPALRAQAVTTYRKLPLAFEANQGQADPRVKFRSRGKNYQVLLTPTEAVLGLRVAEKRDDAKAGLKKLALESEMAHKAPQFAMLGMKLKGANAKARGEGQGQLALKSNYFIGNDRSKWLRHVPNYAEVKFAEVYPGIDLVYHGSDKGRLEYDFVVAPGADPAKIEISFEGAKGLKLDRNGDLAIKIADGEVVEHAPVIYQHDGDKRRTISGGYVLRGKDRVSFKLASYDRNRAVVIDPFIVYSTYLGGSREDEGFGIKADIAEDAYITGFTCSTDFPISSERLQGTLAGSCDAFVTKFNQIASGELYSTFIGGSGFDVGTAIAIDVNGLVYLTGRTLSGNFPNKAQLSAHAFQTTKGVGEDAFILELDQDGDELIYSTFLGGDGTDQGNGITVDPSLNTYVTGTTCSTDFPTTPTAPQPTFLGGGGCHAFVTKMNASGTALVYSTYLGGTGAFGTGSEDGTAIAIDSARNAYVTGSTRSTDFPAFPTTGPETAYQITKRGAVNAYVVKYSPAGKVIYSTLLGGTDHDEGRGIGVDSTGSVYVAGLAGSADFVPSTLSIPGAFKTKSSVSFLADAFVAQLDDDGDALLYFTYLGGNSENLANALALDSLNNAWVTGNTCSTDFPTTPGAFQPVSPNPGNCIAFVAKVNTSLGGPASLVSSSYLGGSTEDEGNSIALDPSCNAFVTGRTFSTDFPATQGSFQRTLNGPNGSPTSGFDDAFVTRIAQWNLTGRAFGLRIFGLGVTGDTGNVSTASNSSKSAFFAGVDAGLVQATLLNGNVTTDACTGKSTAEANAATVILRLPDAPIITAKAVQSHSATTCDGSTGTMNVASLQVGTAPPGGGGFPPNTTIPLGTGNFLTLNEQIPVTGAEKGLIVNAIHLHASGLDAVVASSKSDIGRCPACPTGTTLCPVAGSPDLFSFCKDLKSDANNCGTCGNVCSGATPVCNGAGVCVP